MALPHWAVIMIAPGPQVSLRERYNLVVDILQGQDLDYEIILVSTDSADTDTATLFDLQRQMANRVSLIFLDSITDERMALAQGARYARGSQLILLGVKDQQNNLESTLREQLLSKSVVSLVDEAHKQRTVLSIADILNKPPAIQGGPSALSDFLPFGGPHLSQDEMAEVLDTLRSGWIGFGPKTKQFEQEFAEYVGATYAIAVNSATAALHLSLLAHGIGPGDEVITTPLTFAATANVISHVGATPVFADIDPVTFNLDPQKVQEAITERTRAILPVHYGGLPCDMNALEAIAAEHNLVIVEDAAHAIGARYKGQHVGATGNLTCYSFYANKNLTTAEGGMLTTNDPNIAEWATVNRLHGLSADAWKRYGTTELIPAKAKYPGYKYNMTDIQASLGLHQLCKLETNLQQREAHAALFDELLTNVPEITLQPRPADITRNRHALHLYLIKLDLSHLTVSRNAFVEALRAENIGAGIHYTPLHLHPYYQERLNLGLGSFPIAEEVGSSVVSLPLTPQMRADEITAIAYTVRCLINYYHN